LSDQNKPRIFEEKGYDREHNVTEGERALHSEKLVSDVVRIIK